MTILTNFIMNMQKFWADEFDLFHLKVKLSVDIIE